MATHSSFLPGESRGQGSLLGCCLWGCTESDTTEVTQMQQQFFKKMCIPVIWPQRQQFWDILKEMVFVINTSSVSYTKYTEAKCFIHACMYVCKYCIHTTYKCSLHTQYLRASALICLYSNLLNQYTRDVIWSGGECSEQKKSSSKAGSFDLGQADYFHAGKQARFYLLICFFRRNQLSKFL